MLWSVGLHIIRVLNTIMTVGNITKEYGHFLVKFGKGQSAEYHVVPRSKIIAEGHIKIGDTYNTIWGSSAKSDDAEIISTGEWLDMRKLLRTKIEESSQSTHDSANQSSNSESVASSYISPPPKHKKLATNVAPKPSKPDAKVLGCRKNSCS